MYLSNHVSSACSRQSPSLCLWLVSVPILKNGQKATNSRWHLGRITSCLLPHQTSGRWYPYHPSRPPILNLSASSAGVFLNSHSSSERCLWLRALQNRNKWHPLNPLDVLAGPTSGYPLPFLSQVLSVPPPRGVILQNSTHCSYIIAISLNHWITLTHTVRGGLITLTHF